MQGLIFRLESKFDENPRHPEIYKGFYRVCRDIWEFMESDCMSEKAIHPAPEDDSKLNEVWGCLDFDTSKNWHFGFSSYEQLKRWFYDNAKLATIQGYICLRVYQCEDVHVGYTQAIFDVTKGVHCVGEFDVLSTTSDVYAALEV